MTHNNAVKQLPRGGRQHQQHRQHKSDAVSFPHNHTGPQPRHLPHHHAAHQLQTPPPRGQTVQPIGQQDITPPQTPRAVDSGSKKKKRPRKPKDNNGKPTSPDMKAPSVEESIEMPTPKRIVSVPAAASPPSPTRTPTRAPVYAGPTFHQSPAPASLPVPKFFSKSVPAPPAPGLQAMLDEEDSKTDGSQSSISPSETRENHLERLFRADREEKARKKSQSDDSSDNDSTTDSSNPSAFFGMEPDSPFNPRSTQVKPRPQATRTTTEPLFSMDVEKAASRAAGLGPNPKDDKAHEAALRQFLYQSPISIKQSAPQPSGNLPLSPASRTTQSPSWSQHNNGNQANHSNGSPVPQRRQNYGVRPAGHAPIRNSLTSPPPKPQFNMQRSRPGPVPVYNGPVTPPRQTARTLFHSQPRHVPAPPPAMCGQDVAELENNLRRILKLQPSQDGGVLI